MFYLANPWGLLGLLAVPTILAIHFFQRRFPPVYVAGLHLWGEEQILQTEGRRFERLPWSRSLILELLAALLLSLALSDPRYGDWGRAVHLVVVLDNSASMSSRPANQEASFRDLALEELRKRYQASPRGSVLTVIATGRRPVMLAGPAVGWEVAEPGLKAWQPRAPRHDFSPAWDLAASLAEGGSTVLFLTDTALPENQVPQAAFEVVAVGRALENVAFSAARWQQEPNSTDGKLFVRVTNHGKRPTTVEVTGTVPAGTDASGASVAERSVFRESAKLDAGASQPWEFQVPGGLGEVVVRASAPEDGLALDSEVRLIEPKPRLVSYHVGLPSATAAQHLQQVLDVLPGLQKADVLAAQLVFAPGGKLPESRGNLWWVGWGPIDPAEEPRKESKDIVGPFLLEKRHPLLTGVTLDGVVWGGVQPLNFAQVPLVSAGTTPLLGQLTGTQTTAYLLNLDLDRSNLPDSPDWPVLLANLVEQRRDALPGLRRWNYRLNEQIEFRLFEGYREDPAAAERPLKVVLGDKPRTLARTSVVEVPPLDDAGVYELRDGDQLLDRFAVNLIDGDESELTKLSGGIQRSQTEGKWGWVSIDDPYSWWIAVVVLLTFGLLFWDWDTLKRRPSWQTAGRR